MTFGVEKFSKWRSCYSTYPELYPGQLDLYHNSSPSRAPIWSHDSFSSYALDHLLDSSLSTQLEGIFGYGTYLCFVHLSKNEVIISRVSMDGIESKRLVRRNRACFSRV